MVCFAGVCIMIDCGCRADYHRGSSMTCCTTLSFWNREDFSFGERDTRSRFALVCWVARQERGASITCWVGHVW